MNKACNYCTNYALYVGKNEDYMCRNCIVKAIYEDRDIDFKKITGIERGKAFLVLEKLGVNSIE